MAVRSCYNTFINTERIYILQIFVYGANTQGRHGKGAALEAVRNHGAIYGVVGLKGQSYGIITKELRAGYPAVTVNDLDYEIDLLIQCANDNPSYTFKCTPFGTGLAGFTHEQMILLFEDKDIPDNLILPDEWQ